MASPAIDYTSRDFESLRDDMIALIPSRVPEWTSRSPSDFGIALIDLFAYIGDNLSYYADRIANETFLATATQRDSVLRIAEMLDYRPRGNQAAKTTLQFTLASNSGAVTIPAGTQVATAPAADSDEEPVIFETDTDLVIGGTTTGTFTGQVGATEGETIYNEQVGTSDGLADQSYPLFRTPVIDDSWTVCVDEGSGFVEWRFVPHLIDANGVEAVYTTRTTAEGVVRIVFGDNVNGRIPAIGASITVTYRVGGGVRGNVGAGTLTEVM